LATNEKSKKKPPMIDNALGGMKEISARKVFTFFGENIFLAKNMALSINVGRAPYMVTSWDHGVHPLADIKAAISDTRVVRTIHLILTTK